MIMSTDSVSVIMSTDSVPWYVLTRKTIAEEFKGLIVYTHKS